MKRFEDLSIEDLAKLRKEIVLNSIYIADYENTFGFSPKSVSYFFDGYVSFLEEIANEDNFEIKDYAIFLQKYDNIDNLYSWYNCYDDFSWIEYIEEENN